MSNGNPSHLMIASRLNIVTLMAETLLVQPLKIPPPTMASIPGPFLIIDYLPGDADGNGTVDLGDILFLISYLYKGGPAPVPMAVGNVNADCVVDLGDVLYLISYLYKGGPAPQPSCCPEGYGG